MYAPVPDSAKEKLEMCWITVRKPTKEDKCQLILHFSFYFRQKNFWKKWCEVLSMISLTTLSKSNHLLTLGWFSLLEKNKSKKQGKGGEMGRGWKENWRVTGSNSVLFSNFWRSRYEGVVRILGKKRETRNRNTQNEKEECKGGRRKEERGGESKNEKKRGGRGKGKRRGGGKGGDNRKRVRKWQVD